MDHLLEIAKKTIDGPRIASSFEDFLKSAESVGDGVTNLVYSVKAIEAKESLGHLPDGTSSRAKRLVLDLLVKQSANIKTTNDILQHILAGAEKG